MAFNAHSSFNVVKTDNEASVPGYSFNNNADADNVGDSGEKKDKKDKKHKKDKSKKKHKKSKKSKKDKGGDDNGE